MAGAWIKVEHITPDKPEIVSLADALKIDQDAAFGKCMRVWIWADQQTISGDALSVTPSFLDRLTNCPGFSDALIKVGWLASRSGRFWLPNFDRHNGQTAKNRALSADRMKRHRDEQSVTESSPDQSKSKKEESPIVPFPKKKHAFEKSPFFPFEAFRNSLPEWSEAKCRAYFERAQGYSDANGGRYLDWRRAVQNWDREKPFRESVAEAAFSVQPDFRIPEAP